MKKILIPTDFSHDSYQTIEYVCTLFKNEYCEFYFFNTYTYGITGLNAIELLQADDEWFDIPKEKSLKQLGKLIERHTLKSSNPKHSFNAISDSINLIVGIKENIEKIGVDLVILTRKLEKTIGKTTENILEKVRTCPILIVPPHASTCNGINLTIASNFKQKINTSQINKFVKSLENTNINIEILVLEDQKALTTEVVENLETLIVYLKQNLNNEIRSEYIQPLYQLKDYAASHPNSIICIIDKKPDLFRKIGFYKSSVISKLKKLNTNTVLTVHQ